MNHTGLHYCIVPMIETQVIGTQVIGTQAIKTQAGHRLATG
jgi:hypothetical protein